MSVIARTDPHAAHDDVYRAHPDWIAVDAEGKKRRHWAFPDAWVTCTLGPFSFDLMTAVTREIAQKYDIDGIFTNRWEGSGMCYCKHCAANFRKATGFALPRSGGDSRIEKAYREWKEEPAFRAVASVGCRNTQAPAQSTVHRKFGRRSVEPDRHGSARQAFVDSVRRPPGT